MYTVVNLFLYTLVTEGDHFILKVKIHHVAPHVIADRKETLVLARTNCTHGWRIQGFHGATA